MTRKKKVTKKDADEVLKAMLILARTVDHVLQERVVEAATEKLSGSKLQLLHLLSQRGPQTPTQIARFLGVSKPAVTHICDGMMNDKLVRRETSKQDRRELDLKLTPRGRSVFRQVREEQRHLIFSTFRQATDGDPGQWVSILHKMSVALAQADRAFKYFCVQCGAYADGSCVLVGGEGPCLFLRHKGKVPTGG